MKNTIIKNKTKYFIFLLILSTILSVFMSNVKTKTALCDSLPSEIVIDANSLRVLHENNADIKRGIASTTKILTAITVIENFNVDKKVVIKREWTCVEGSSIYLKEGENLTVKELLYGLMLRSGNDAAVALANALCGSEQSFCALMNKTAKKAGAINSNFVNPHGLSESGHYSTARDLALITVYALKNELFSQIVSTKSINVGSGESARTFINKNKMLYNYEYATGVKTGYTKNSGRCLVSSAEKNGFKLVCVVLNCAPMFERSEELLQKAYSEYKNVQLLAGGEAITYANVENTKFYIPLGVNESVYYPLAKNELDCVKFELEINKISKIPIKTEKQMGTIKILLKNRLLFSKKIFTIL